MHTSDLELWAGFVINFAKISLAFPREEDDGGITVAYSMHLSGGLLGLSTTIGLWTRLSAIHRHQCGLCLFFALRTEHRYGLLVTHLLFVMMIVTWHKDIVDVINPGQDALLRILQHIHLLLG